MSSVWCPTLGWGPRSTRGSNESNCGLIIRSCLLSVKIFALWWELCYYRTSMLISPSKTSFSLPTSKPKLRCKINSAAINTYSTTVFPVVCVAASDCSLIKHICRLMTSIIHWSETNEHKIFLSKNFPTHVPAWTKEFFAWRTQRNARWKTFFPRLQRTQP